MTANGCRRGTASLTMCALIANGSVIFGQTGQYVCVADRDADPEGFGGNTGAVFLYDNGALVSTIASLDFVDPIRVESDDAGNIYILDASADPLQQGLPTGAVFRADADGNVNLYAVSQTTSNLADFTRAPDGTLYMTGTAIVEPGPDFQAAIFAVDTNGAISVVSSGVELSEPTGVAVAPNGDLIVSDRSATVGSSGEVGAVFRIANGGAISVVGTSLQFADLQGVAVSADGSLFHVIDESADPNGLGYTGAVFDVTSGGAVSVWATDLRFTKLNDIIRLDDGSVLVLDTDAVDNGLVGSGPGVVFRLDGSGQVTIDLSNANVWSDARGVGTWTPPPASRLGDLDGDGDVDTLDFLLFVQCFGGSLNPPAAGCPAGVNADLDGDSDVDTFDFVIFAMNFGG